MQGVLVSQNLGSFLAVKERIMAQKEIPDKSTINEVPLVENKTAAHPIHGSLKEIPFDHQIID